MVENTNNKRMLQTPHSIFKAAVYLDNWHNQTTVVKDFSASPFWIRNSFCLFVLNREVKTLQRLDGIEGIPKFYERIGKYAYRMQYIDGIQPSSELLGKSKQLLEQMSRIVSQMHAAGITHNDLRANNLLLSKSGQLFMIDFGAVVFRPQRKYLFTKPVHRLFNYLVKTDHSKVARLQQRYSTEELSAEAMALINKTELARQITQLWKKYVLPVVSPTKHGRDSRTF